MRKPNSSTIAWILVAIILIGAGTFVTVRLRQNKIQAQKLAAQQALRPYLDFSDEVYATIIHHYWDKLTDAQLTDLYRLAAAKINTSTPAVLPSNDINGLNTLISSEIKPMSTDEKKVFVTNLANIVLNNLKPFGRSSLYTQQNIQALNNELRNVDTSTNLYQDLGVDKAAPQKQIDQTYQQQSEKLAKQNTPAAKQQLALVNRAYEALKTPERRQQYDQTGQEPAVTFRSLTPNIFYIKISRFSPDLLDQLKQSSTAIPGGSNALILDVRGNIGGAIDQLPAVLGNFIGENEAAFKFYQQANYFPFASTGTALPAIAQFKRVVILTDNQVQSSTEMMVSSLKRFHFGTVVGAPTRGWGSVEYPFPIAHQIDSNQTYSVFLVQYLTLADDDQPIEGRGVQPDINSNDPDWQNQLAKITSDHTIVTEVSKLLNQQP